MKCLNYASPKIKIIYFNTKDVYTASSEVFGNDNVINYLEEWGD